VRQKQILSNANCTDPRQQTVLPVSLLPSYAEEYSSYHISMSTVQWDLSW
jgi:hypothetical protein